MMTACDFGSPRYGFSQLQDAVMVNLTTGVRIHLAASAIHEGVATVRIAGRLVHVMLLYG